MGVSLLGKMKLYELAKELNLASKELLERAGEIGIELKSHLSTLEDDQIEKLKKSVSSKKVTKKQAPKKEVDKKEKDAPVIIRREVIIEDEKKEETKRPSQPQNKTPFVGRNKNKDYNIVYRNKPEKPKTVSELFGLNKNENKSEEKKIEKVEKVEKVEEKPVQAQKVVEEKAEVKPAKKVTTEIKKLQIKKKIESQEKITDKIENIITDQITTIIEKIEITIKKEMVKKEDTERAEIIISKIEDKMETAMEIDQTTITEIETITTTIIDVLQMKEEQRKILKILCLLMLQKKKT